VLAVLLAVTARPTPARGQGFEALILPRPSALNQVEGTGISPDGVVAGYGWEVDDTSPRLGLRWTPDFGYHDVEAPQMNGHLTSVVFNGIDPVTNWPFGAARGLDTANAIHAIQVDEIVADNNIVGVFRARWSDRNPPGVSASEMLGGVHEFRVGSAVPPGGSFPHALLWDTFQWGTEDLHPSGFTYSKAAAVTARIMGGIADVKIAGWAEHNGVDRAIKWSSDGVAGGFLAPFDVQPSGYDGSRAYGISSRWTVGTASPAGSGGWHAMSFDSPVTDLNPPWAVNSTAVGASEAGIVGYSGVSPFGRTALYWSDADPNQVTDLHQFVPSDFIASYALAINDAKQIVGTAVDSNGERHAVLWRPLRLFSLGFRPGFARYAQMVTAYVFLEKPAPTGGLRIRLSPSMSLNANAWSLQGDVVVLEGQTSAKFSVATIERRPPTPVRATITATWGEEIRRVTLTITP
jgi:probable HAF family extracellular repeat protein